LNAREVQEHVSFQIKRLGIKDENFIGSSYIDLLENMEKKEKLSN